MKIEDFWMLLRSVIFLIGFCKIDAPKAPLKSSIPCLRGSGIDWSEGIGVIYHLVPIS